MKEKYYYRRKLPHWQPPNATFFVTYRLVGSIPVSVIDRLKENYKRIKTMISVSDLNKNKELSDKYFSAMEDEMDKNHNEPHWLKNEKVAGVIMDSLFFRNNIQYKLFSSSIMSNHVHIVISPLPNSPSLNVILQNHKKFTAIQCNKILERNGQFWEEESFDTLIRDNNHFNNCIIYTLNNPVNSDLVKYWRDWPWTYIDPQLLENGRY